MTTIQKYARVKAYRMKYKVHRIKWNCDCQKTISRLPKMFEIEVPEYIRREEETFEYLADQIEQKTGCGISSYDYEELYPDWDDMYD